MPAQQWLFKKYAPAAELVYIDLGKNDINNWGKDVSAQLPADDFIVFGLDDYLPIDYLDSHRLYMAREVVRLTDIDRFDLGSETHSRFNKGRLTRVGAREYAYLRYPAGGLFTVSCQFSVWRTATLKRILGACTTPWNFELKHQCNAATFQEPVFRWIEESALSSRHPGKVNVMGLRRDDLAELIGMRLIDPTAIQFGMPKGPVPPFDINNVPSKYRRFYE